MRITTATTCLAIGLAVLLAAPQDDSARAVEGDLNRRQERPIVAQFNRVVRQHRAQVNGHRRFFTTQQRQIIRGINAPTLDPQTVTQGTALTLLQTFDTAVLDTRSAIADLEQIVLDFYDDNSGAPDSVIEFSGDLDSLLSGAVRGLNLNNARMTAGVMRGSKAIEKRACAKDLFLDIDIFGMPEFVAPQFDRRVMQGSGEARHRANIIFTLSGNDGVDPLIAALAYADIDDDDELWFGLFEPDGAEIGRVPGSPTGNGTFGGSFGGFSPGTKNLAGQIVDPDFPAEIFADGFESGDTSAWSYTGR